MAKVKRVFYLERETSRMLDQVIEAQCSMPSKLVNKILQEALEEHWRKLERLDALNVSAVSSITITAIAVVLSVLA